MLYGLGYRTIQWQIITLKEIIEMSELQFVTSVVFKKDKETKNCVRFANNDGEIVGTLYVNKQSELAKNDEITVEIP